MRIKQAEKALINIKTFADGHSPPNLVFPAMPQVYRKGRRRERERNRPAAGAMPDCRNPRAEIFDGHGPSSSLGSAENAGDIAEIWTGSR